MLLYEREHIEIFKSALVYPWQNLESLRHIEIKIYFFMLFLCCKYIHHYTIYSSLWYCDISYDFKNSEKLHWRMHHRLIATRHYVRKSVIRQKKWISRKIYQIKFPGLLLNNFHLVFYFIGRKCDFFICVRERTMDSPLYISFNNIAI